MFIGELAAAIFWQSGDAETDESPHAYHGSHTAAAPIGVGVVYAGWQPATSLANPAHLKFIVFNGLSEPVTYHGFSDFEAVPVILVNGEYKPVYRCMFGMKDYVIQPDTAAEFHVTADELGGRITADSRIIVGLYLYLRNSDKPNILATTEPFYLPEDFSRSIVGKN